MTTEGTYPYAVGGVSSWCDVLIGGLRGIDWDVLPLIAGGRHMSQRVKLPPNARLLRPIELWSEDRAPRRMPYRQSGESLSLPTQLLRGLMPWEGDLEQLRVALVQCRLRPQSIRREFRGRDSWQKFLAELEQLLTESHLESAPAPIYDAIEAARLYQALYWVARTAAVPTPPCDLLHVTAAGWAGVPALVHGILLVGDPSLAWGVHGVHPAIALLPSVIGSFWGGYYLWNFYDAVPRGLRGVSLKRAGRVALSDPAMSIFVGGVARLLTATVVLSAAVAAFSVLSRGTDALTVFVAFGCVGMVSMLIGMLEAFSLQSAALIAAAAALASELAWHALVHSRAPGAALAVGATVGVILTLAPLLDRLARSGSVLATTLWIQ